MDNNVFIGQGHNPNGPDIPLGFGMLLEGEPVAKANFGSLSNAQKVELINYMQQAKTGEDSEFRVINAVQKLKNHQENELINKTNHDNTNQDKFY